jgi:NADPH2:quinone reductase
LGIGCVPVANNGFDCSRARMGGGPPGDTGPAGAVGAAGAGDAGRATGGGGVDAIIEMAAHVNLNHDFNLLARRGRVAIVGSRGPLEFNPRGIMAKEATVRGGTLWAMAADDVRMGVAALNAGFENGTLKPVISEEIPLKDAARSQERVMSGGAHGKVVLVV